MLGIGFGHPFYRPYALPEINLFGFEAYVPHNSLIWIWIKMGIGGLVALLYIFGRALAQGAARARAAPPGVDAVIAMIGVVFVAMYAVFLYVDIAWEPRNVVLLALSIGLCTGPLREEARTNERAVESSRLPTSSIRSVDRPLTKRIDLTAQQRGVPFHVGVLDRPLASSASHLARRRFVAQQPFDGRTQRQGRLLVEHSVPSPRR